MFQACSGHVVFCFDLQKKKTGACFGRVLGMLFFYQIFTLAAAYNAEWPLFLDFFPCGIAKNNNIFWINV